MRYQLIIPCLVSIFVLACGAGRASAEMRTWTSVSGATLMAEFVEQRLDEIVLRNEEGEQISINLRQLSRDDQAYVGAQRTAGMRRGGGGGGSETGEVPEGIRNAFGERLINARRQRTSTADLAGKKIGLYFSAQWCPPCRAFTPVLVDMYKELQEQGKPFEIIFVSHDRSENDMIKYMRDYRMPWLAVPFDAALREDLKKKHGIRGIPALIIVDETGATLSANGRSDVSASGAAAFDRW